MFCAFIEYRGAIMHIAVIDRTITAMEGRQECFGVMRMSYEDLPLPHCYRPRTLEWLVL
jgi:hypothetical protein